MSALRSIRVPGILAVLVVLQSFSGEAVSRSTSLAGDVSVPTRQAGSQSGDGFHITVSISGHNYSKTTLARIDGSFVFDDVPDGDYVIEVHCRGYESGRIEVQRWSSGDLRPIVVPLGPRIEQADVPMGREPTTTVDELKVPAKAQKEITKAQIKARENNYAAAIDHWKKALEIYPAHAAGWNNLGVAYLKTNRDPDAEAAFKKALSVDPRFTQAQRNLGILYFAQGKNQEAIEPLKASLENESADCRAHTYLAVAYYREGRYPEAETWLLKALDIKPDFHDAVYQLALTQFKLKDYQGATESVDRYLAAMPDGSFAERAKKLKGFLDQQQAGSAE